MGGLKLLKYILQIWANSSKIYVQIFRVWLLCITCYKHVMSCRGYVYPVIKLIRKVLYLLTFKFAESV